MSKAPTVHFVFNAAIESFRILGEELKSRYGDAPEGKAKTLVAIGGDGSVLYTLPKAKGRKVYGLVPMNSESIAYTANVYDPAEDLLKVIADCETLPIYPLDVKINYLDGTSQSIDVYSSLSINRDSGQAARIDLSGNFNGVSRILEVSGEGLAFSTPMGSTGQGYSNGGPIVGLNIPCIIATGIGLGRPRGLPPIIATGRDSFTAECIVSKGKRPLRIDFDGNTIRSDLENPAKTIEIALKTTPAAILAVRPGAFHPFKRLDLP